VTAAEKRRRERRRRRTYSHSEASFQRNLREIDRLRREDRGHGSTAAAIERREAASRRWVTGETTR
jgi:hypothetical protein